MAKQKKKMRFRLIHLTLIVVLVYVAVVSNNQRMLMNELKEERAETEAEILRAESEIETLKFEMEDSDSLEFVERVARDDLGMVRPKEIIYIDINKAQDRLLENLKGDN